MHVFGLGRLKAPRTQGSLLSLQHILDMGGTKLDFLVPDRVQVTEGKSREKTKQQAHWRSISHKARAMTTHLTGNASNT